MEPYMHKVLYSQYIGELFPILLILQKHNFGRLLNIPFHSFTITESFHCSWVFRPSLFPYCCAALLSRNLWARLRCKQTLSPCWWWFMLVQVSSAIKQFENVNVLQSNSVSRRLSKDPRLFNYSPCFELSFP